MSPVIRLVWRFRTPIHYSVLNNSFQGQAVVFKTEKYESGVKEVIREHHVTIYCAGKAEFILFGGQSKSQMSDHEF